MSVTSSLLQATGAFVAAVSFAQVMGGVFSLAALTGFAMFFRPLLVGIARALALAVRPRLTDEQLATRRKLHNSFLLQRGINVASTPADAAVGSRG
jgi:uncharacterized membrane protein